MGLCALSRQRILSYTEVKVRYLIQSQLVECIDRRKGRCRRLKIRFHFANEGQALNILKVVGEVEDILACFPHALLLRFDNKRDVWRKFCLRGASRHASHEDRVDIEVAYIGQDGTGTAKSVSL